MRPDQFLQLAFMVRRKLNRWGLGCRHGSPSLSRHGGGSHSESTPDSPATAGGEPISAVCCVFDSPQRGTESPLSARCTSRFLAEKRAVPAVVHGPTFARYSANGACGGECTA